MNFKSEEFVVMRRKVEKREKGGKAREQEKEKEKERDGSK